MKKLVEIAAMFAIILPYTCLAQAPRMIQLDGPDTSGAKQFMLILKERKSSRSFSATMLSTRTLSDLLWAAFGINRADGRRTAPSAMNWQEIDIYVVLEKGAYLYEAKSNSLRLIAAGDLRHMTGTQDFVERAPLNIVYVADMSKVTRVSAENEHLWTGADCGFIAQNVYLFCASEGLACVVRGSIEKAGLAKALKLEADQRIILAQTVGYPR